MRRRERPPADPVPDRLRSFDAAVWLPLVAEEPPGDVEDPQRWRLNAAFRLWSDARERWDSEHGWWPGDSLDRLKEQLAERRRVVRAQP